MSLRPLNKEGTRWQIDWYPSGRKGKRRRRNVNCSHVEAQQLELSLRHQHRKIPLVSPTIMDVIPAFMDWAAINLSEKTCEDLRTTLKHILPIFGNLQVSAITPATVQKLQKTLRTKPRTANKCCAYLQSIIKYMVKNKQAAPLNFKIDMLPYTRPLPQIPEPSTIIHFLDNITDPAKKCICLLMFQCGLRWHEATHIEWKNINLQSGMITLTTTKRNKQRICCITQDIQAILVDMKKTTGFVFLNPSSGKPFNSFKTMFRTLNRKLNIYPPIRPHLLRHAFATYMLAATNNLRLVQQALGHSSIAMTEVYTHIQLDILKQGTISTQKYINDYTSPQGNT